MSAFLAKPGVQKTLRYTAAYLLFFLFASLALVLVFRVRANIFDLCFLFNVDTSITMFIFSWGTYILLIPYIIFISVLEPYLNQAAKTSQVLAKAKKIFFAEAGIAIVTGLISLVVLLFGRTPLFL